MKHVETVPYRYRSGRASLAVASKQEAKQKLNLREHIIDRWPPVRQRNAILRAKTVAIYPHSRFVQCSSAVSIVHPALLLWRLGKVSSRVANMSGGTYAMCLISFFSFASFLGLISFFLLLRTKRTCTCSESETRAAKGNETKEEGQKREGEMSKRARIAFEIS